MKSAAIRTAGLMVAIAAAAALRPAAADPASVLDATVQANRGGTYAVSATVFHKDTGWTHYADKFEVMAGGKVLGERVLFHPHVDEQPFTRSLGRVEVPIGVTEVTVRAYCNKDGAGERTFTVGLPPRK